MNNFKMNYAKKYHYMVKYFIMAFPLLWVLGLSIFSGESFTTNLTYVAQPFRDFINTSSIFSWYSDLLLMFGVTNLNSILIFMPLWIILVIIFDTILDIVLIVPNLIHKLVSKIGGDYRE